MKHTFRIETLEDRLAPAVFTVNTADDGGLNNPATLSIRDAVDVINLGSIQNLTATEKAQVSGTVGSNDTIRFAGGYNIFLFSPLVALGSFTLDGSTAPSRVTLDGRDANAILNGTNQNLIVQTMTLTNGNAGTGNGGAILTGGNVTLDNVVISSSSAVDGGGVYADGTVTINNSTLFNNTATGGGGDGGAVNSGKLAVIERSNLFGNTAGRFGSALFARGDFLLDSTRLSSNSSTAGGTVYLDSATGRGEVFNSTLANNFANNLAGARAGIVNQSTGFTGSLILRNSTLSGTPAAGANGVFVENRTTGTLSFESSIISTVIAPQGFSGNNSAVGDVVGNFTIDSQVFSAAALKLLPLTDNGGLVSTMALQAGSVLIDAGTNTFGRGLDGRSSSSFPRVRGNAADIGAFESEFTAAVPSVRTAREFAVGADVGGGSVSLRNPDNTVRFTLTPFGAGFTGGVRTATGDFNNDGVADLVAGTGPGRSTQVKIFDGKTQAELFTVDPFEAAFQGGVYVAAGDINGDGLAELAITPDEGGGPRVRVFNGNGFTQIADFFGIDDPNFRGGARASIGDLNADGKGDLLVAAGFGGGPRVAAFNGSLLSSTGGPKLFDDFFAFEQALRNGIFVAAGDVNGDGFADIVAGGGPGGGPRVYVLNGKSLVQNGTTVLDPIANFFAGDVTNRGGIRVAVKHLDGDATADILTGSGTGAGSRVTAYLGKNTSLAAGTPPTVLDFDAFAGSKAGVFVG